MLNNKNIKSNLLFTSVVIGGLFLVSPTVLLAQEVATSTSGTPENKTCSGYTYSRITNSCSLVEAINCDTDNIFSTTKEMCELENNITNPREERSGGTILDKVKADRKTFIKDRLYEDDSSNQITTDNINILSSQIIEAQKQILLFEINNTIIKTRSYIPYFENIIYRLEQNLASSTHVNNEDINKLLLEAKTKIDLASSTINKAENNSDDLLTTSDISKTISNIKTQIIDTISILKEVREALKQVISITKNIL